MSLKAFSCQICLWQMKFDTMESWTASVNCDSDILIVYLSIFSTWTNFEGSGSLSHVQLACTWVCSSGPPQVGDAAASRSQLILARTPWCFQGAMGRTEDFAHDVFVWTDLEESLCQQETFFLEAIFVPKLPVKENSKECKLIATN